MLGDALDEGALLGVGGVVNAALQHAAAVAVRGDVKAVGGGCIINELGVLGAQAL